jgi:hypothetical protein
VLDKEMIGREITTDELDSGSRLRTPGLYRGMDRLMLVDDRHGVGPVFG